MRQVSLPMLRSMLAEETDEVLLPILRIEHPDLAEPILLVRNNEPLVRSDGTYLPYYFNINLPEQSDDEIKPLTVSVDNTDLEVNDKIRTLVGPPKVTFSLVLASSPDTAEAGPYALSLQAVPKADAQTITGTLGYEMDIFVQTVPAQQVLPSSSPGMFL